MLDEFVATTGYHRKYATRILKHGRPRQSGKKHGFPKVYQGEVVVALEQIWEICGRICSKRLHPFLPEILKMLERCGELQMSEQTKALLLRMSRSTIDRCLGPARFDHPHGLSTTKPGSLLKKAIPVRTYLPFLLLGLDSDNGGEFINDLLFRYRLSEKITFTRSRPYQKNDQAHVEQKNWSIVPRLVGYDRFETETEYLLLQSIYADLRLYSNFFQPVLKLVSKERMDKKLLKRYD